MRRPPNPENAEKNQFLLCNRNALQSPRHYGLVHRVARLTRLCDLEVALSKLYILGLAGLLNPKLTKKEIYMS